MVSREMREMSPTDFTERFGEYPSREGLTILVVSSDGPKYYRQIQMMSKTLLIVLGVICDMQIRCGIAIANIFRSDITTLNTSKWGIF